MSGAEVAGLALAVLPLLTNAASHYNNCLTPLRRYRKFAAEVEDFVLRFRTQKGIFRAQCRLLLGHVVERSVATDMLAGRADESWDDPRLEKQLAAYLGDQYDAGIDIARLISKRLEDVNEECQKLEKILTRDDQKNKAKLSDSTRRNDMGEKLKFSFSKSSQLDRAVEDLRKYNHDFRTLSYQSTEESQLDARKHTGLKIRSRKEVDKYKIVGKAAQLVYEALRKACTKHTDHLAHFCVQVEEIVFDYGHLAQTKFSIAFTHMTPSGSVYHGDPIWFVIDSTLDSASAFSDEQSSLKFEELKQSLKRQVDCIPERIAKKSKKSVTFQTSLPQQSYGFNASSSSLMLPMKAVSGEDFCDFLRQSIAGPAPLRNTPLHALENSAFCRQIIYPSATDCARLNQPISLSQLISPQNGRRRMEDFSPYERVRLAKILAVAVLQYHSTPWLRKMWRSEDVYFFGLGDEQKDIPVLTPPYVNAKVPSRNGQISQTSAFANRGIARNTLLYSLGVFLIEIAFQISLKSLQRPTDIDNSQGDGYAEFFLARRLGKSGCTGMGTRYDKIIHRLVECDFGCGDDLSSLELQDAFHDTVISPLETLEQELRKIHLDD